MAPSAVAMTTVSILPVMLKAIPHRVRGAVLGLSSLVRSGYFRWMSPVKRVFTEKACRGFTKNG